MDYKMRTFRGQFCYFIKCSSLQRLKPVFSFEGKIPKLIHEVLVFESQVQRKCITGTHNTMLSDCLNFF